MPRAVSVVPSSGSTAMSTLGGLPSPISSPLKSIGASSFSPSPMTTTPSIWTVSSIRRIASTAAPSAVSFSPRPTQRAAASAPYSVTRTSSMARLRSGRAGVVASTAPGNLHDSGWLFRVGGQGLSERAAREHQEGSEQAHEPADLEHHVDGVAGLAEHQAVQDDQREGDHADDHRDLARLPAEFVPAGDDVRQDERREAGRQQEPVQVLEGLAAGELAAHAVVYRVRVARGVGRVRRGVRRAVGREPGQEEEGPGEDERAQEPDVLVPVQAAEREPGLLLRLTLLLPLAGGVARGLLLLGLGLALRARRLLLLLRLGHLPLALRSPCSP